MEPLNGDTVQMRPQADEHDPYYAKYISLVPDGDVVATLEGQISGTLESLAGVSEQQALQSYAPGKWNIKEALGHLIDTERVLCYRALRVARNDPTPIEGFDQDPWVRNAPFDKIPLRTLLDEFQAVRTATVYLFRALDPEAWIRRGTANNAPVSVRALAYVIAGHELHHRKILGERYAGTVVR